MSYARYMDDHNLPKEGQTLPKIACKDCGGQGTFLLRHPVALYPHRGGYTECDCPTCNGTGEVDQ